MKDPVCDHFPENITARPCGQPAELFYEVGSVDDFKVFSARCVDHPLATGHIVTKEEYLVLEVMES